MGGSCVRETCPVSSTEIHIFTCREQRPMKPWNKNERIRKTIDYFLISIGHRLLFILLLVEG